MPALYLKPFLPARLSAIGIHHLTRAQVSDDTNFLKKISTYLGEISYSGRLCNWPLLNVQLHELQSGSTQGSGSHFGFGEIGV